MAGRGHKKPVVDGRIRCNACGEWKQLAEFHANHKSSTGRLHRCIPCTGKRPGVLAERSQLKAEAVKLYEAGVEVADIARQVNRTSATVHAWMRAAGYRRRMPPGEGLAHLRDALATTDRSQCIEWPYRVNDDGYGATWYQGRSELAHRVAFHLEHGRWPLVGRHTCDNRACFNPDHVIDGTTKDNAADCVLRGRKFSVSAILAVATPEERDAILAAANRLVAQRYPNA